MSDIISSNLDDDMKNSWRTDPLVFNPMNQEFNFDLDAAASDKNHLVSRYLTKEDDALATNWSKIGRSVWINPPYGRGFIQKFMMKSIEQKQFGVTSTMLVPATLDAKWLPMRQISEIRIITGGRLAFYAPCDYVIEGKNGNPDRYIKEGDKVSGNTKGSMFVIFRPSDMPCFLRMIDRDELLAQGSKS